MGKYIDTHVYDDALKDAYYVSLQAVLFSSDPLKTSPILPAQSLACSKIKLLWIIVLNMNSKILI